MHLPFNLKPQSFKHLAKYTQDLVRGKLWFKIILWMLLGVLVGIYLNPAKGWCTPETGEIIGNWLAIPGKLFLTLIQMIVVPMIVTSIIGGIAASEDTEQLKSMGSRLTVYFLITTTVAVSTGIAITLLIKPGNFVDVSAFQEEFWAVQISDNTVEAKGISIKELPDGLISIIPNNPLGDMVEMQLLQVVIFSIIVGLALVSIKPDKAKPLLNFLNSMQTVAMKIVSWTMYLAPFAVFGLLAQITIKTGLTSLLSIVVYIATVVIGLLIVLLFYMIVAFAFGRIPPMQYMSRIKNAQLLAFSTCSSMVTMPLSIKVAEEELNVRPSISNFVIPIGATVNMDGTALFQGVTTIFLAQIFGLELGLAAIIILIITSIGASIGTPATPGVGIVILTTLLTSVGIPVEGLVLIIGVDRILEMLRTATNVTGDLTAAVVMERIEAKGN